MTTSMFWKSGNDDLRTAEGRPHVAHCMQMSDKVRYGADTDLSATMDMKEVNSDLMIAPSSWRATLMCRTPMLPLGRCQTVASQARLRAAKKMKFDRHAHNDHARQDKHQRR
jgi:hypothetical protein